MSTVKMEATLTFQLAIRNRTGIGTPYFQRTAHDKCTVKNALLEKLRQPEVADVLARWKSLLIDVDPSCCELADADARAVIEQRVAAEIVPLENAFGFQIKAGDPASLFPCSKLPVCGHVCGYLLQVVREDTDLPWIEVHDGVEAEVLLLLSWETHAMELMEMLEDHAHGASPAGGAGGSSRTRGAGGG